MHVTAFLCALPASRRRARAAGRAPVSAASRAPRHFARVHRAPGGAAALQTRVTRYRAARGAAPHLPATLDLYALVHYADRAYYAALNRALSRYDRVYFECITAPTNLSTAPATGLRTLRLPVGASRAAAAEARALALVPQMDAWDSALPNGFVADLTTAELAELDLRSRARPRPRARVASAARNALRAFCFLLPCPEAAALLVDALYSGSAGGGGILPRAAAAALLALARGDLRSARKLVFAHVVEATTAARAVARVADPATRARNLRVLDAVRRGRGEHVAVVFGAWHAGHLATLCETDLAMRHAGGYWLDAVSAERAEDGRAWAHLSALTRGDPLPPDPFPVAQLAVIVLAIQGAEVVSAFDYIAAFATSIPRIFEVGAGAATQEAAALSVALYTLRHVAGYVMVRNWIVLGGADTQV